ncbi:NAD-dependent epimerase/dehydratase family protein [Candidatus Pelagibacter communis]|uniref:NAD-dependent epimerase/dehydratase family protein n=1 Tax=Pelagibacter ubique TaxID=198252 RepID=UPI00094D4A07|nr:NAD-dependent epimerase/dehydratase family protein [Candidatus Pelagibacter ubique]
MKNLIIVTGGAGFVGSNLIEIILKKTKYQIISLDNYSSGSRKNHIKNKRVKYFKGDTKEIQKLLNKYQKNIKSVFHFGEFSRIYQSFKKFNECFKSNSIGSQAVFKFCLDNKIKLIYSATSASLGNKGNDKNLSPYAFTKSKNLELLENLKKWFNFKFEIIFFYNVYGPRQIKAGDMATVIGIFENQYLNKKPLTVVKPGNQTRRFTHILDTVQVCFEAFKANKCRYYSISNKNSYSILQVANMFKSKILLLKPRVGERYASALTKMSNNNKIIQKFGKLQLKDYISSFINSH